MVPWRRVDGFSVNVISPAEPARVMTRLGASALVASPAIAWLAVLALAAWADCLPAAGPASAANGAIVRALTRIAVATEVRMIDVLLRERRGCRGCQPRTSRMSTAD